MFMPYFTLSSLTQPLPCPLQCLRLSCLSSSDPTPPYPILTHPTLPTLPTPSYPAYLTQVISYSLTLPYPNLSLSPYPSPPPFLSYHPPSPALHMLLLLSAPPFLPSPPTLIPITCLALAVPIAVALTHSPWESPASHPLISSSHLCSLMLLHFIFTGMRGISKLLSIEEFTSR